MKKIYNLPNYILLVLLLPIFLIFNPFYFHYNIYTIANSAGLCGICSLCWLYLNFRNRTLKDMPIYIKFGVACLAAALCYTVYQYIMGIHLFYTRIYNSKYSVPLSADPSITFYFYKQYGMLCAVISVVIGTTIMLKRMHYNAHLDKTIVDQENTASPLSNYDLWMGRYLSISLLPLTFYCLWGGGNFLDQEGTALQLIAIMFLFWVAKLWFLILVFKEEYSCGSSNFLKYFIPIDILILAGFFLISFQFYDPFSGNFYVRMGSLCDIIHLIFVLLFTINIILLMLLYNKCIKPLPHVVLSALQLLAFVESLVGIGIIIITALIFAVSAAHSPGMF